MGEDPNRPASIRVQRRVEWSDTDASGFYHNTLAFRLIEVAETAMLERLGILEAVYGRMPRVHISAEFTLQLQHRDLLDVYFSVVDMGQSSMTYEFQIERDGKTAVRAKVVVVLLDRAGGRPTPWPEDVRRLLLRAGPQAPEILTTDDGGR
jgi:2-aminobenzoate-CoA ligase